MENSPSVTSTVWKTAMTALAPYVHSNRNAMNSSIPINAAMVTAMACVRSWELATALTASVPMISALPSPKVFNAWPSLARAGTIEHGLNYRIADARGLNGGAQCFNRGWLLESRGHDRAAFEIDAEIESV